MHSNRRNLPCYKTEDWQVGVLADALAQAASETGLVDFPEKCPWFNGQVVTPEFFPDDGGRLEEGFLGQFASVATEVYKHRCVQR